MDGQMDLDDSWEYDVDESNISWAEESSQEHAMKQEEQSHDRPNASKTPPKAKRQVEPELVMPSPQQNSQVRYRHAQSQSTATRTSSKPVSARAANFRSTPVRRSTREGSAVSDAISDAASNSLVFLLDIIGQTLRTLKTPISWILAAYALAAFVTFTQNLVTTSINNALSPICRIPGTQYLNLPMCKYSPGGDTPAISASANAPAPEFDALMSAQQNFEEILADQSHAIGLPTDMKRSESSIRDLKSRVQFSTIPSKNELVHEFDGFIETARMASFNLIKFNSHVGRGVDLVLSTARWTQRVLDDLDVKTNQRGIVPAFISDTLLAPFKPLQFNEARLLVQYIEHTSIISTEIEKLIGEAQELLSTLQNLEDRLEVIHDISLRDNLQISADKEEILLALWSKIGGNRVEKQKADRKLELLREVGKYRRSAFQHVAATVLKLQSMQVELEGLRARVGSAGEAHDAGAKHIPLSVHIENIQLGVERLEIGRQRVRELEEKQTRRVLDSSALDKPAARYIEAK